MTNFSTDSCYKTKRQAVGHTRAIASFLCPLSIVAAVFLSVCFVSTQGAVAQNDKTPAGNRENGKKLYDTNSCTMCHGMSGEGGSTGPRIAPDPIDFPAFIGQLRHPAGEMPSYDEMMITDAEAADIYAFLKAPEGTPKAQGPAASAAPVSSSR